MKEVTVCGDKKIYVFDDLFKMQEKEHFFEYMQTSNYKITSNSSSIDNDYSTITSFYSEEELSSGRLKFYYTEGYKFIDKMFDLSKRQKKQIRVNCFSNSSRNLPHTDNLGLTLLYYVNLKWEVHWSGHTAFLNEDLSEIEHTIIYKPGRLVIFDATIPHMILIPTKEADYHRLTFVIQYK